MCSSSCIGGGKAGRWLYSWINWNLRKAQYFTLLSFMRWNVSLKKRISKHVNKTNTELQQKLVQAYTIQWVLQQQKMITKNDNWSFIHEHIQSKASIFLDIWTVDWLILIDYIEFFSGIFKYWCYHNWIYLSARFFIHNLIETAECYELYTNSLFIWIIFREKNNGK